MEIKVLGPGCPNCQDLERRVKQALQELNVQATVVKVPDYAEMAKYVMTTPGLVINEKLKHEGKPLPRIEKIKEWIKEEMA